MCRPCPSDSADASGSHDARLPFPNGGDHDVPFRWGSTSSVDTLRGAWTWGERVRLLQLRSRVLEERLERHGAKRTEHTIVQLPDAVYTYVPVVAPPQALSTTEFYEGMVN